RNTALHLPSSFAPQGREFPGWIALALAAVALLDRMRGRLRGDDDPRLVFLVCGMAAAWVSMRPFVLPGTRIQIGTPFGALGTIVPGLDAVRALYNVGAGLQLVIAFLAGVGAAQLLAACPARARPVAVVAVVAPALLELFLPRAVSVFGRAAPLAAVATRPPQ